MNFNVALGVKYSVVSVVVPLILFSFLMLTAPVLPAVPLKSVEEYYSHFECLLPPVLPAVPLKSFKAYYSRF